MAGDPDQTPGLWRFSGVRATYAHGRFTRLFTQLSRVAVDELPCVVAGCMAHIAGRCQASVTNPDIQIYGRFTSRRQKRVDGSNGSVAA
jgi:hypothetical protein